MPKSRKRKIEQRPKAAAYQPNEDEMNAREWVSGIAQPFVVLFFFIRVHLFFSVTWYAQAFFWVGCAIGLFSQLYIFIPNRFWQKRKLLTGGVFKYTRHPMYTGMVIADIQTWFSGQRDVYFTITALLFYGSVLVVGWIHEQEVLVKFGPAAEAYYARTPRLFFLYPFVRKE